MALAALAVAGCSGGDGGGEEPPAAVTVTSTVTTSAAPEESAPSGRGGSLADMVARVIPSVVNVRTTTFGGGRGDGSGVVLDRSGIIVTNNHVVEGTTSVDVALNDAAGSRTLRGEVIGTAPERDLAVIRVDADDLVPVTLGRSAGLRLGDGVVAIGFPLGLGGPTVTQGIVSGLDRTIEPGDGPRLQGLLQTDAAINPGNSGGALVDLSGRLVGINTAGARLEGAENIGFAIAIDEAMPVIAEIRQRGGGARLWIGAALGSVESDAAAVRLGLDPSTRGVVVTEVFEGGPAARAQLAVGDVIVRLDDEEILSEAAFVAALDRRKAGSKVLLELIDSAGPRRASVTLTKRPETPAG